MNVGVVGAGISGLGLVHELAGTDVTVQAFEATNTPGGLMRSRTVDGHVLNLGPQRLRLTSSLERLIDELDLTEALRMGEDRPIYVHLDGRLRTVPRSARELVTTDLLTLWGKVRMLKEPMTAEPRRGESVDDFLTRKFGRQAASRFLGPLYSGLYGTDSADMPVEHSLGRSLERAGIEGSLVLWALRYLLSGRDRPPICSFDGGLGALSQALYDRHSSCISLETPVQAIESNGSNGYVLETATGATAVDAVVLTTPAPTAASLLESIDDEAANRLGRLRYNPIAVVHLESQFRGDGMGVLVPSESSLSISGTTWNARILDRDGLSTCYLDPTSYPAFAEASDAEVGAAAAADFETITGVSATPVHVHRWQPGMPAYDRSWEAIEGLEVPSGIHLCANYLERPGIPGRLRHAARTATTLAEDSASRS